MNNLCCKLNLLVSLLTLGIIVTLVTLAYYEDRKLEYHINRAEKVVDSSSQNSSS